MHARITQLRILPGQLPAFRDAVDSLLPNARRQAGFRALIILQTQPGPQPEATVISVWDSLADMKTSEQNMYYYQALARVQKFCEGFPHIREHEVLVSEFAAD